MQFEKVDLSHFRHLPAIVEAISGILADTNFASKVDTFASEDASNREAIPVLPGEVFVGLLAQAEEFGNACIREDSRAGPSN